MLQNGSVEHGGWTRAFTYVLVRTSLLVFCVKGRCEAVVDGLGDLSQLVRFQGLFELLDFRMPEDMV